MSKLLLGISQSKPHSLLCLKDVSMLKLQEAALHVVIAGTLPPAPTHSHSCLSLTCLPRCRHFQGLVLSFRFLCVTVWIWVVPQSLMCSRLGCRIVVLQGSSGTFRRGQLEGSEVTGRWPRRGHWEPALLSHPLLPICHQESSLLYCVLCAITYCLCTGPKQWGRATMD